MVHEPRQARMKAEELAALLAQLHRAEKGIGVLLFGIQYDREIEACPDSIQRILRLSGVPPSYDSEIYKGRRLARHVRMR